MRVHPGAVLLMILAASAQPAFAQSQPANTVRALLAAGRLGSVTDTPLRFRLLSVQLPAAGHASYTGSNSLLYALSGGLTVTLDGVTQAVSTGSGVFIPAGQAAVISASGADPARILLFVLSPADGAQQPPLGEPAQVEELYRTPELTGLRPGPYEFSLTRVTLPARMPANPAHYRSGAALYYVLAGTGSFTADGKTEPKAAPMAHFEPYRWVHQWANPGDSPLVLLQANISQEGIPAVLPATQK